MAEYGPWLGIQPEKVNLNCTRAFLARGSGCELAGRTRKNRQTFAVAAVPANAKERQLRENGRPEKCNPKRDRSVTTQFSAMVLSRAMR